jgi:hypothetical protein
LCTSWWKSYRTRFGKSTMKKRPSLVSGSPP